MPNVAKKFLAKKSKVYTIAPIEVPFRGTRFKTIGERTFEPWTMTVYNDQEMQIRGFFEQWANSMKGFASNVGQQDPSTLFGIVEIRQLNMAGEIIGQPWVLQDCWPSDIVSSDIVPFDIVTSCHPDIGPHFWQTLRCQGLLYKHCCNSLSK